MVIEFNKIFNKKEVLNTMQCYEDSTNYGEYCKIYEEVVENSVKNITPKGYYIITDNNNYINNNCEQVIFCLVTLGSYIDEEIKRYFDNNDYLKGMMLNTIGDQMLFDISNSLYQLLQKEQSYYDINLTSRIEPGSSESSIEFQKIILDMINEKEPTDITITSGYMFSPTKTLSYYYGASTNIPPSTVDHNCSKCTNPSCTFRKYNLIIKQATKSHRFQVKKGENLLNVIRHYNFPIKAYCGGKKVCGKCKVKLIEGNIELSDEEKKFLTDIEIEEGIILSCFHNIDNDMTIELNEEATTSRIQTGYKIGNIKKQKYKLLKIDGIIESHNNNSSVVELINKKLGVDYKYSLNAVKELSNIENLIKDIYLLSKNNTEILRSANNEITAYGVGIDIGTTTIVITLIDLLKNKEIGIYKNVNPQKAYGADVISRINYAIKDTQNTQTKLICDEISSGIKIIVDKYELNEKDIVEITISGNTTMQYLLTGVNPYKLSISPFTTMDLSLNEYLYSQLFTDNLLDCNVTLLPGVSAYIGSDIIAGFYYSDLIDQEGNILFIDIGTNGEIALKTKDDSIICAATAAGPAFEGANIKCGMESIDGAICNIRLMDNKFKYDVIGKSTPKGICGSALVDITAELLDIDVIDNTGKLNIDKVILYQDEQSEIGLYQEDIRQLQLAKSAISAGISVLLDEASISINDVDKVFLAGGFGSNLNIANAITIGLFQKELKNKVETIGNSSLGGCVKYLLNDNSSNNFDEIKSKCKYIELSTNMKFNKEYIMNMYF
ncbi:ASKHA domain-containing protein [Vallitalea sp.]|jgi:uncharacterized 2Fe-2S/4Fe-4S cluster protein (DUF4445 family)|uniref:ASKHA domain-containing protein n=1 Tax=Vallitalea sp. TaxID=1882829 RepID=UPI0025D1ACB9|nr:ASKHA domain-containing protein [Vallitalea sp.]MCT4686522.1 ASKHA domain-containing protein [Vallitalea sp.]